MIQHCKDNPIIQISSQKPSKFSKYDCDLEKNIYSCYGVENQNAAEELYGLVIHDVKNDTNVNQILQISSQEPPIFSKHDCVSDSLLFMLGT